MPTAGRRRGKLMGVSDVCSLWIPSRHIGVFIRWRVWCVGAEGRAGFFLRDAPAALAACRAQGAVADRWPQPLRGDGRECIESASETAPALRRATSAALAIRKIASALSLHLKRRQLA